MNAGNLFSINAINKAEGTLDLVICAEQVRWEEMQAIRAGRSVASVVSNFNVAIKALDQQWQVQTFPRKYK